MKVRLAQGKYPLNKDCRDCCFPIWNQTTLILEIVEKNIILV